MGESHQASELRNPGAMAEGASWRESRALGFGHGCATTTPPWGLGFLAAKDKGWAVSPLPSPGAVTPKEAPASVVLASSPLPDLSLVVLLPLSAEGAGVAWPSPAGRTRRQECHLSQSCSRHLSVMPRPLQEEENACLQRDGRAEGPGAGPGGRHAQISRMITLMPGRARAGRLHGGGEGGLLFRDRRMGPWMPGSGAPGSRARQRPRGFCSKSLTPLVENLSPRQTIEASFRSFCAHTWSSAHPVHLE